MPATGQPVRYGQATFWLATRGTFDRSLPMPDYISNLFNGDLQETLGPRHHLAYLIHSPIHPRSFGPFHLNPDPIVGPGVGGKHDVMLGLYVVVAHITKT